MDHSRKGKTARQLLSVAALTALISLGLLIPVLAASGALSAPDRHDGSDSDPDGALVAAASSTGEGSITAVVTVADSADADLDGLLDTIETANGCTVGNADSDGDGLSDGPEVILLGTRCDLADSDVGGGDGFSDSFERALTGTVSGASAASLVDADSAYPQPPASPTSTWTTNQWAGFFVTITGGTGAGQVRAIISNTADTLNIDPATPWSPTPIAGSTYAIQKVGTDPLSACAADGTLKNEALDATPPDTNDDQSVNILDVGAMAPACRAAVGDANYEPRLDLNADGGINILDVGVMAPFWRTSCAP